MATAALAAAPVEITAELARFTLRGEELLGLVPGVVLTVPADRRGRSFFARGARPGPRESWSTSRGSSASG